MNNNIANSKKLSLISRLKPKFNLIIADAKRIKPDVFMIIITALAFLSILVMCAMFRLIALVMEITASEFSVAELTLLNKVFSYMSYGFSLSYYVLGFFIIAAISIFSSRDFGYKTVRLKLLAGNSRTKIYLSTLTVNLLIFLTYYVAAALLCTVLNLVLFGYHDFDGAIILNTLLALVPYITTVAIATFITMTTKTQVISIIINIGIVYVLPQITTIIGLLTPSDIAQTIIASIPYQSVNNILTGNLLSLTGQTISDAPFPAPTLKLVLQAVIPAAVIIPLTTIGGIILFNKADLN